MITFESVRFRVKQELQNVTIYEDIFSIFFDSYVLIFTALSCSYLSSEEWSYRLSFSIVAVFVLGYFQQLVRMLIISLTKVETNFFLSDSNKIDKQKIDAIANRNNLEYRNRFIKLFILTGILFVLAAAAYIFQAEIERLRNVALIVLLALAVSCFLILNKYYFSFYKSILENKIIKSWLAEQNYNVSKESD